MSDAAPDRQIVGLTPRRRGPDVSRLMRKSRDQATPAPITTPLETVDQIVLDPPAPTPESVEQSESVGGEQTPPPAPAPASAPATAPSEVDTEPAPTAQDTVPATPAAPAAPAAAIDEPVVAAPARPSRVQQTIYMAPANRDRAKAAFLKTNHMEGDVSWSEFIEQAVLTEVERREQEYNGGVAFAPETQKLRPGRRPSS